MKQWFQTAKLWARRIQRDVLALWFAARDARTPIMAKIVAGAVAAYALSPVDLIPDFIPVLGYLDDVLIVPLGILLAVKLTPQPLMEEFRAAASEKAEQPASKTGLALVIIIWLVAAIILSWSLWLFVHGPRLPLETSGAQRAQYAPVAASG